MTILKRLPIFIAALSLAIAAHGQQQQSGYIATPSAITSILGGANIAMTNATCNVVTPGSACTVSGLATSYLASYTQGYTLTGSLSGTQALVIPLQPYAVHVIFNSTGQIITVGGVTGATVSVPSGTNPVTIYTPDGANYYTSATGGSSGIPATTNLLAGSGTAGSSVNSTIAPANVPLENAANAFAGGLNSFSDGSQGLYIGPYTAGAGYGALYGFGATPSNTNYVFIANPTVQTVLNNTTQTTIAVNGVAVISSTSAGVAINQPTTLPSGSTIPTASPRTGGTGIASQAYADAAISSTCNLSNANNICITSAPYNASPNGLTATTTTGTNTAGTTINVSSSSTFNAGNGVYIPGAGTAGQIYSFTMNASGSGYTVGDTLTISGGGANATIKILAITAGSGAPITQYDNKTGDIGFPVQFGLSAAGTGYSTSSGTATTGGTGTGFTVNVVEVAGYVGAVVSTTPTSIVVTPSTSSTVTAGTAVKHDEAAAFTAAQAALATTTAGGIIWIPCGYYEFSSALQDPTGANAVLPMPKLANSVSPQIQIGYRGCTVPGIGNPFGGTTLQTSAPSGNFIGGYDAVTGGGVPPYTNVWFDPDYVTFVTPSNSADVIINCTAIINCTLGTVTAETANNSTSTTVLSAGYMAPQLGNNVRTTIQNLTVGGTYTGVLLSEHTTANYIAMNAVHNCYVFDSGFTPNVHAPITYTGNSITVNHLWAGNCVNSISGNLTRTMVDIRGADIENPGGNIINDAGNLLHGIVEYNIVYPAGGSTACAPVTSGGTGLVLLAMQCGSLTNAPINSATIVGGTMDNVVIGGTTPAAFTATSGTVFLNQNAATQIVLANHNAGTGSVSQLAVQSDVGNVGLGFTSSTYTAAPADVGYLNVGTQTGAGGKSFDFLFQGVPTSLYTASLWQLKNGIPLAWGTIASTGTTAPTQDTGISRDAAATIDVGNGTQGDKSGTLKAAAVTLTGLATTVGVSNSGTAITNSAAYTQTGSNANTLSGVTNFTAGLQLNGSQTVTAIQGSTGTKIAAATGTFTAGNIRSTDSSGNEVDTGTAAGAAVHSDYWDIQGVLFSTSTTLGPVYQELSGVLFGGITARLSGTISCTVAPVVVLLDLGTNASTVYGSATVLESVTTGTSDGVFTGSSVGSRSIAPHYYGIGFSAGTCVTAPAFDITILVE